MFQMPVNFGLIIAFFLPGVLTTYSLRYVSSRIDQILRIVEDGQVFVGPGAILIMGALVAGLIVSSVRVVVLDPVIHRTGVPKPRVDYGKLITPEKRVVFNEVVENVYRFYQFYGNIFLALLLLAILRYGVAGAPILSSAESFALFVITLGAIVALFVAARQSMRQLCRAIDDLCQ
jgi:hypothetical protein